MIPEEYQLDDNIEDDVNVIRKEMLSLKSWNKEKYKLQDKLVKILLLKKYISFTSTNPERYQLRSVGQSYLYDVPLYKRGHLKKFIGKRIRLICMHTGRHHTRLLMAGIVGKTPPDKIIKKLIIDYSFPRELKNNDVLFKTRRFKLFKINKGDKLTYPNSKELIDLAGVESVLIDGKNCKLISAIISNNNKKIQAKPMTCYYGKFVFGSREREFDSYEEIIIEYKKFYERSFLSYGMVSIQI